MRREKIGFHKKRGLGQIRGYAPTHPGLFNPVLSNFRAQTATDAQDCSVYSIYATLILRAMRNIVARIKLCQLISTANNDATVWPA
jgi:hypothetical protein